jgi:hypothetical protein
VYDWKRTIKQLLEDTQVHYSIIQFFSLENIYSPTHSDGFSDDEVTYLTALHKLSESEEGLPQPVLPVIKESQKV